MTRRTEYEQSLVDPALSAMLREAYADDPALASAPGRTERIMRTVLAVERPRRRVPVFFTSLAWGAGAMATAALLFALVLGLGRSMQPWGGGLVVRQPKSAVPDHRQGPAVPAPPKIVVHAPKESQPIPPVRHEWKSPSITVPEHEGTPWRPTPPEPRETPVPAPSRDEVVVAAALYQAGSNAYHYGDYETAYQAFHDSYETVPTPEAILDSGQVLMHLAQEQLSEAYPET